MIQVYTDGATNVNTGKSGAGIYIKSGEQKLEYTVPLPYMSNHEAEFHAIIEALRICKTNFPGEILSFRTDSKVAAEVIDQGRTKNKQFLPLLETIQAASADFPFLFIKWIPEKENSKADQLARKAIHQQER
ncbi:ribonuclease HI family protein [Oceanobacillus sp. J11TS1]|uniref:ribonuclease HI family protein n=1 Tax=Oceanobacillus sp. J11TS1 TaxID=2807191 RepID=UPI001B22A263|nr:ribonuclease HI family protein [Oceanobacillus sp. J11TS1]GIO24662.1 ribonuclease H [Oceanobacillus sp. J11TS1]